MDKDNYNPFRTAIKRDYLSKPMKELVKRDLLKGDILDYACGNGLDSEWLWKEYHIQTWRYDKYNEKFKDDFLLDEHYDTITCFYMFNVIPSLEEHNEVLEQLKGMADNIYISVRADKKAIKDSWIWSDKEQGYWTSHNTFQRFYCSTMIDILFGEVEYIVNDASMKLFKLIS